MIGTELQKILFLDIETVPAYPTFDKMPQKYQELWEKKATRLNPNETGEQQYGRAGIYAEFGKVVCISIGIVAYEENVPQLHLKSFYGEHEEALLKACTATLNKHTVKTEHVLCAHNGREFDYPYIARRCLVNGLPLPHVLNISQAKPWEVQARLLDTMQLWKFGDYKHYTSLDLLCAVFDVETPKDDIDGSQVGHVFWQERDIERIARYCEKDVLAMVQLFCKMTGRETIAEEHVALHL